MCIYLETLFHCTFSFTADMLLYLIFIQKKTEFFSRISMRIYLYTTTTLFAVIEMVVVVLQKILMCFVVRKETAEKQERERRKIIIE